MNTAPYGGFGVGVVAPRRLLLAELVELVGVAQRKQARLVGQRLRRQLAQRRVVVEDEDAAAERADDEVVLAPLDLEIARLRRRDAALQLRPALAAVDR